MSEVLIPSFNFSENGQLDATPEEIQQAEKFIDTRFKPGVYDLKILSCVPYKKSANDENWWTYKVILTIEGVKTIQKPKRNGDGTFDAVVNDKGHEVASINYWVMVPVNGHIKYNPNESKAPLAVYGKFKKFMAALGIPIESTYESLRAVVMSSFAKPKALDGKVIRAEIGYHSPYLVRSDDTWTVMNKEGTPLTEEVFTSRETAEAYALDKGLNLQFSTEVLKFLPAATNAEAKTESAQKATKVAW